MYIISRNIYIYIYMYGKMDAKYELVRVSKFASKRLGEKLVEISSGLLITQKGFLPATCSEYRTRAINCIILLVH